MPDHQEPGGLNQDLLLTIRDLEVFFDGQVSYRCIDQWIRRGKLASRGHNERGQVLVRLGDALRVEATTYTAKRGRPRQTRPPRLFIEPHL